MTAPAQPAIDLTDPVLRHLRADVNFYDHVASVIASGGMRPVDELRQPLHDLLEHVMQCCSAYERMRSVAPGQETRARSPP